jgi:hypothetical protein
MIFYFPPMQPNVFFPHGVSSFEQLATQGYVFVDKTPYIEKLEVEKEKFVSFLRPRRFGKSLFLSMLEHYYDILYKDRFQELFGKYYIGKNPTPLANTYRVLLFDFSGVGANTFENVRSKFNSFVKAALEEFFNKHPIFSPQKQASVLAYESAEEMLIHFFRNYVGFAERIYLLIDEYDHFTHEILIQDLDAFQKAVSFGGYVRKFYEVIKSATRQGVVDKIFITGVSPITLDGLTSGFNILTHLTQDENFAAMMGFSEKEVRSLLRLVLEDPSREKTIMQDLRYYYNGYKFCPDAEEYLYNPDMVLYFLKHFKSRQRYPKQILDINIAPDYKKLKNMFEIANFRQNREVLEEVLEKGVIVSPSVSQFSFEMPFGKTEFINLLYYLGNLTIKKASFSGLITFKIPNQVIEQLYWKYYAYVLEQKAGIAQGAPEIAVAVEEMAETSKTDKFFTYIQRLLQALSNRDYRGFSEKHVKMAIIAYVMQSDLFYIQSEREVKGGGYIDLELYVRPGRADTHHQFALEIKYLKKEEEAEKDRVMQEAKAQLLKYYQNDEILQSKTQLHLLAAVVVKDSVFVEEASLPIV